MKVIYVSANLLALLIGDIPESSFHKFQAGCQTEITVLPFLVRVYKLKARASASWFWLEITRTVDCWLVFAITSFNAVVQGLERALWLKLLNSICNNSLSTPAGWLSVWVSLLILARNRPTSGGLRDFAVFSLVTISLAVQKFLEIGTKDWQYKRNRLY